MGGHHRVGRAVCRQLRRATVGFSAAARQLHPDDSAIIGKRFAGPDPLAYIGCAGDASAHRNPNVDAHANCSADSHRHADCHRHRYADPRPHPG